MNECIKGKQISDLYYSKESFLILQKSIKKILSSRNISESDLTRANFKDASMYGSNLEGSNLFKTNFEGANLKNSNLFITKHQ